MFNLFKKKQIPLIKHQYRNLTIVLPSHWQYELEGEDQEACFDPKSQSTLRFNIVKAMPPTGATDEENIKFLTADQPYITTAGGYLLTGPAFKESVDSGNNISLITWKLINYTGAEKIMAVITYTILSAEKESAQEKEIFNLLENSLQNAELSKIRTV
ncbi:hypothetical protein ACFFGT_27795 [Mucilaginibacter angelicae]|uniref:Uncharacterized protein n=1 Tax=Mucilaginibacter angelicae TaxID=869718 RepID=A0ABV6LF05_9SPHI